jgi:hypothetical protein
LEPALDDLEREILLALLGTERSLRQHMMFVAKRDQVWPGKHTYLLPLDAVVRARILALSQPHPKRAKQATDADPAAGGGAAPTRTLQTTA